MADAIDHERHDERGREQVRPRQRDGSTSPTGSSRTSAPRASGAAASRAARASSGHLPQDVRELRRPRPPGHALGEARAAARCRAGRRFGAVSTSASSARDWASASSESTTSPAPAERRSSAATPAGGTAASTGRRAARYSYTLPEMTVSPRPSACGIRSSSASAERCAATASPERQEPGLLPRVVDVSARAQARSDARRSPTKRTRTWPRRSGRRREQVAHRGQERARAALAEERTRVHDRERPLRRVRQAVEVAQIDAVADHVRLCGRARVEAAELGRDRLGDGHERARPAGDRARHPPLDRRAWRARRGSRTGGAGGRATSRAGRPPTAARWRRRPRRRSGAPTAAATWS